MSLFANKILVYLWTNVFTHDASREQTFRNNPRSLESLIKEFKRDGFDIFNDTIVGSMEFIE